MADIHRTGCIILIDLDQSFQTKIFKEFYPPCSLLRICLSCIPAAKPKVTLFSLRGISFQLDPQFFHAVGERRALQAQQDCGAVFAADLSVRPLQGLEDLQLFRIPKGKRLAGGAR